MASADKPFRFPATFTFVVRSFTVLDGIGKSLNPRFDISEIAAPYARGLLLEVGISFKTTSLHPAHRFCWKPRCLLCCCLVSLCMSRHSRRWEA